MINLRKIVSGGQTGVDQAALRAAQECGLPCGGWCPPGRVCESGTIPSSFPLQETPLERSPDAPKVPRSQRTEWNVRDSDATLILLPGNRNEHDPGTSWALQSAVRSGRPVFVCDPFEPDALGKIQRWLGALDIGTLNVAGPSEGTVPGIGDSAYTLLVQLFSRGANAASEAQNPRARHDLTPQHEPLPWWLGFPLARLRRLKLRNVGILSVAASLALIILLLFGIFFLSVKLFGLRIVAGQVYLGPAIPTLGSHATVDATAGFQESGIKLRKGEKLVLRPEGRIHIAMDHANNLAQAVKGIIVHNTQNRTFSEQILTRYPLPALNESAVFYRDWCGPEGEASYSDLLEDCKLRKEIGWGALLAVILPTRASARADPYDVLKSNALTPLDLTAVPSETTIIADRDGWLTFIVNEAIISPSSPSRDSQLYYDALKRTAETLTGDPRHRIPLQWIPLIWFADNNGAFRITISYESVH